MGARELGCELACGPHTEDIPAGRWDTRGPRGQLRGLRHSVVDCGRASGAQLGLGADLVRTVTTSSTRAHRRCAPPAGKLVSASMVRLSCVESAAMDSAEALSHVFTITSKPVAPGLHLKAEFLALIELLPPEATASDVAVLASLWAHSGPTGEAFPGQKRIAREARVSERTVRDVTKRLEKAGLLTRRVPHLATRITRKTTRYSLPLAPRPRFVRPVLASTGAVGDVRVAGDRPRIAHEHPLPSVVECLTAQEPQHPPCPEQPDQRQPLPVDQRQPLPPKSQEEIIQSQSARVRVVPQAEGLAAQWTAPAAQRPAAAPSPRSPASPPVAAKRPAAAPNTAAALATLRAWVPPAKQLSLGLSESPLESTKGTADRERVIPTTTDEPRGS